MVYYRHDGKPEDVLNPKKKQLDKITPVFNLWLLLCLSVDKQVSYYYEVQTFIPFVP